MKIIIIGGGPGGYVAALKAAILGADVTLIEKSFCGGTCLNRGCIPTKSFLKSAEVLDAVNNSGQFGIISSSNEIDFNSIFQRKDAIVKQLVMGVNFLVKKRGIKLLNGFGTLLCDGRVEVQYPDGAKEVIEGDKIILATGSVPVTPSAFKYDGKKVITSDEILNFKEIPKSLIIVGGGVIGCEFGQFFSKMGTKVTIIEMADHILPFEDPDVAEILCKKLLEKNISVYEETKVENVEVNDEKVTAVLSNGEIITAEYLLLSIGRQASIEGIGIENVGIKTEKGKIVVNERMQTNVEKIYAIGDIVDSPFLAHVASKEGIVAVENILGRNKVMNYSAVPRCIYTEPEIAGVGLTEAEAKNRNITYSKGKFNFSGIGKAMIAGDTEGFVKIIVDRDDKIIGASIVGPHATELLNELTLAIHLGLTSEQVGDVIHPHPTLSEALMEAVHDVHKEAVHSY